MKKFLKKEYVMPILAIILAIAVVTGVSYAIFQMTAMGTKNNVINAGTLQLTFDESSSNEIDLTNAIPMTDSSGMQGTPYTFTITNTGTLAARYNLKIEENQELYASHLDEGKIFPKGTLKIGLTKNGNTSYLLYTGNTLDTGVLQPGDSIVYTARIWINYDAGNEVQGNHFHGHFTIEASQNYQYVEVLNEAILDNANIGAGSIAQVGDTYYIRGTDPNNYVWYSGMPWRVMSVDSSGQMRLIYDGSIVTWWYGPEYTAGSWDTSHAKAWLNDYMYERMDSSKDTVLVNSNLCLDAVDSGESARTTCTTVNNSSKIVLPTVDEFNIIKNGSSDSYIADISLSTGEIVFWFSTPVTGGSALCYYMPGIVNCSGAPAAGPSFPYRPVITMNKDVLTYMGTGTESDPYRIVGDSVGTIGDSLSERHSGEYVNYDNKLFRIIEQNEQGVKAVYWGENISTYSIDSTQTPLFSSSYGIGLELQTLISDKSQLVENATWYQGDEPDATLSPLNATLKQTNPVNMTVGLMNVGELFYGSLPSVSWVLPLPYVSYPVSVGTGNKDYSSVYFDPHDVRPAIYFKSTATIAGGDGTYENPYTLQ